MPLLPTVAAGCLAAPSVAHGFFTRVGGVSAGIYASLNAGPGSNDDPRAVEENRRRIAAHFGVGPERLLSVYQVHSAHAVRVSGPWTETRPEADGMVTTERHLALCVLAADCAPALFADVEAGVIGAALEATIAEMERAGARRAHIRAAIGPCIGQASYEVGPEYEARFTEADSANARFFAKGAGDRFHFDLSGYCVGRLQRLGLRAVESVQMDTCALEDRFFSNRRAVLRGEGDFGRNASAIMLVRSED